MTNQERIKKYLVGEKGYLKSDISNGKVIMLSGKWGSGKTHFWQNEIASDKLKQELKNKREVYSYVSLYGKTSIEEIENDIFSQAYSSAIGGENFVTKGFSTFTKRMKRFGSSKIANGLNEEQNDNIERTALSRLNNGGILCFDDFERKSKDIDLNDLFGFITQLTLNFNCKVVIILNDDVFEGKEKDIFSNVKEKTVSKFLYYNPTIEELFNMIFQKHDICNFKEDLINPIREIIEETNILNARIYNQVLDNLLEWLKINIKTSDYSERRCFVLSNIYFILYHTIFYKKGDIFEVKDFNDKLSDYSENYNSLKRYVQSSKSKEVKLYSSFDEYFNELENIVLVDNKVNIYKDYLYMNKNQYKSKFYANNLNIQSDIDFYKFERINNFIETGILIDE
ncbi:P-loop NTPase fold protein [Poseidonibacter lekithochrous]|uniref:P-loop NTPase fold protein n=1 Tax=Poseidonibacter lekithochrous TaxID=1904463 RepID=UPI000D3764C8|nr:P-loop NTPase fold protein [Poseidonibacter lekithochrous]